MESDEMIPKGKYIDLDAQLDEVAELPPPKKAKTELNVYKRRTSIVWRYFQMVPTKDAEQPTCKCKKCGKEYIADVAYVGFNLFGVMSKEISSAIEHSWFHSGR